MRTLWHKLRAVAGFRVHNTPIEQKVATLQADMDWVKRFLWALLVVIFARPWLPV
jgi:hypothetical protein